MYLKMILIGVQNIQVSEAMQDFKDLGNKYHEKIDIFEMISKLNTDQKRIFESYYSANGNGLK